MFQNELVKKVGLFPNAAYLEENVIVSFADCSDWARISKGAAGILQKHYGADFLELEESSMLATLGIFGKGIMGFEFYDVERERVAVAKETEYYLPESQLFTKKCRAYSFAAKGGDNKEPHNHNDVGNFIVSSGGRQLIADNGKR